MSELINQEPHGAAVYKLRHKWSGDVIFVTCHENLKPDLNQGEFEFVDETAPYHCVNLVWDR